MSELSLSAWYADPLAPDQAEQLLARVRDRFRRTHDQYLQLRLQEIIAHYWLGRDIDGDIDNLLATCKEDKCRALVMLVYGQLLISRKLAGAMQYLHQGFLLASNLFSAAQYLDVMRRHERLACLVLSKQAGAGQTLQDLLKEADVIRELRGKDCNFSHRVNRSDTVG